MGFVNPHNEDRRLCDNMFASIRLHLDGNLHNERTDRTYDLPARVCNGNDSHTR